MSKKIDELLKQKLNVDELEFVDAIPELKPEILQKISSRKKTEEKPNAIGNLINFFFNKYKAVSVVFAMVTIIVAINFVCTLNIDKNTGQAAVIGSESDTTLTVTSNTYLATLNQFTTAPELPAHTTTALTCISTF